MEGEKETEKEKKRKRRELDLLSSASAANSGSGSAAASGSGQISILEALGNGRKALTDASVCRFFYAEGVPFVKIESPYFAELCQAIAAFGPGYRPPPMKRLRTDMLDKEVDHIKKLLEVIECSKYHIQFIVFSKTLQILLSQPLIQRILCDAAL
jgi:hypothetical protein